MPVGTVAQLSGKPLVKSTNPADYVRDPGDVMIPGASYCAYTSGDGGSKVIIALMTQGAKVMYTMSTAHAPAGSSPVAGVGEQAIFGDSQLSVLFGNIAVHIDGIESRDAAVRVAQAVRQKV